jgi:hypothetical protein
MLPSMSLRQSGVLGVAVLLCAGLLPALPATLAGQDSSGVRPAADSAAKPAPRKPWYERLSLRGYTQVRYNRLLETNPDLTCAQCDRSIGFPGGFFIRRARLVVSGDVHERVFIYIQPDLATDAGAAGQHFLQLRDLYADVSFDRHKEIRARIGQSKVPYGWENVQSSSNRLPFDRDDALNSGVPNERDLGVMLYWTPRKAQNYLKILADSGYKGTGNYGVVGFGVYNGQSANRPELNDNRHVVLRVTWPFRLANGQFIEVSAQGYDGKFNIPGSQRTAGVTGGPDFIDRRAAFSVIYYPQPIGFQAEWNVGKGPEFDRATGSITEQDLEGGYAQAMFRTQIGRHLVIPYARGQYYDGGKKQETDARSYRVRELEFGAEWLPVAALELTAAYMISDRRTADAAAPDNRQKGRLLRLQAQFNY